MPAPFDQIEIGQVVHLGAAVIEPGAIERFAAAFAPDWTADRGAPDAMLFAIWSKLDAAAAASCRHRRIADA